MEITTPKPETALPAAATRGQQHFVLQAHLPSWEL